MADFPTLAQVVDAHRCRERGMVCDEGELWCDACKVIVNAEEVGAHIQAEWVKACTIESREQLDALPDLVAVRAGVLGAIWHKSSGYNAHEPWWGVGSEIECPTTDVDLPAILLWHPERDL